jgi:hypothetical protein
MTEGINNAPQTNMNSTKQTAKGQKMFKPNRTTFVADPKQGVKKQPEG